LQAAAVVVDHYLEQLVVLVDIAHPYLVKIQDVVLQLNQYYI
jgi:hypothetical protein